MTVAFVVLQFIRAAAQRAANEFVGLDWRVVPASALILMALLILAALALACSTRLEVIPTLSVCSALFLLGLVSDYFWGTRAGAGNVWASCALHGDAELAIILGVGLAGGQGRHSGGLPGQALGYTAGYVGAILALALALFEDRELS